MRKQELETQIVDGRLVISIGVETLCKAVSYGLEMEIEEFEITDTDVFASEVLAALKDEEEDGSTLIHKAFDKASLEAIESGCEGCEID